MKKFILLLICLSGYISFVCSQSFRPLENYPSPNAANLGTYGQIPISHFTGQPNISIPIHEIKEGMISLPISLNYHLASVKPNVHHSWVGLGWSLASGGCITRSVRGIYDEKHGLGHSIGFYKHHKKLDVANWDEISYLHEETKYLQAVPENASELMADEFSFNFCGYSGNFYLNEKGGWTVISDDAIKVEFNPNTGFTTFDKLIAERQNCGEEIRIDRTNYKAVSSNTRYFNEFTLITPDGIRYTFGGKFATEYSISYFSRDQADFISTSWFLSKIISPEGRIITFEYEPGNPICEVKPSFHHSFVYNPPKFINANPTMNYSQGYTVKKAMSGHLIFPVYLKKIESSLHNIHFKSRETATGRPSRYMLLWENGESRQDYRFNGFTYNTGAGDPTQFYGQSNYFIKNYEQLKWRILEEISIQTSESNRFFKFSYSYNPYRFKLTKLTEGDDGSSTAIDPDNPGEPFSEDKRSHQFEYNNTELLPDYGTRMEDHWGYYNKGKFQTIEDPTTINFQPEAQDPYTTDYYKSREVDGTSDYRYLKAETLKSIKYPTGGYTQFEYEPHDHSKVVSATYNSLENYSRNAGGLRIARITSYDSDGSFAFAKKYYYTKDINKLTPFSIESSGILAYRPSYTQSYLFDIQVSGGIHRCELVISSAGGVRPQSINSQESHVLYSSVIEEEISASGTSNGYTRYLYTNYDADIYGNNHYDVKAKTASIVEIPYSSHVSNNGKERGKLTLREIFNSNKKVIKSTKYKYQRVANSVLRTVFYEPVTAFFHIDGNIERFLMYAYETNTYSYLPTEEIETLYEPSSGEIIAENNIQYGYNQNKLLSDKTITVKKGNYTERHTTETRYSSDITKGAYSQMINKNMLNYPVEIINKIDNNVIGSSLITYNDLFPESIYKLDISSPLTSFSYYNGETKSYYYNSKPEISILRYDSYYNIRETEDKNGLKTSYLWGYKGHYPVAEIKNVPFEKVSRSLTGSNLDSLDPSMGVINNLRSLFPESLITTYTYKPTVGMTTSTDNRGIVTYYNYGHMNRLREVYIMEDNQKKILQSYYYNYKK